MSKKCNFTITAINKIIPLISGRDEYRDLKIPELTLRVTASDTKTFTVAKKISGKYVRATLGQFPANTIGLPYGIKSSRILAGCNISNTHYLELINTAKS
ncbi:MAG: hypothetical protein ACI9LM_003433 [Alteromonadaceae bacterium]|jgi:hypothetical protein